MPSTPTRSIGPKLSSQAISFASPARPVSNASTPSNPPTESRTAATWASRWVSTPPVTPALNSSTMTIAILPLHLVGMARTCSLVQHDETTVASTTLASHTTGQAGAPGSLRVPADTSKPRHATDQPEAESGRNPEATRTLQAPTTKLVDHQARISPIPNPPCRHCCAQARRFRVTLSIGPGGSGGRGPEPLSCAVRGQASRCFLR